MLTRKLMQRIKSGIEGIFKYGPKTPIATSTASTTTAYSNQRKIDRTSNGVLWTMFQYAGSLGFAHSTDDGATWTRNTANDINITPGGSTYVGNGSLFIDQDDYAHVAYKDRSNGYIYYRRGTPNAARTAWTWSAATTLWSANQLADYPDVVAHREGTGWKVHSVYSYQFSGDNRAYAHQLSISSGGALTDGGPTQIGSHAYSVHTYPSIDFNHTGDGKTVKDNAPHLYVAWSAGATGTGKGIRFKKATYNAGTWSWGTEREIDSTRYINGAHYSILTMFDGTRVMLMGQISDGSYIDIVLYERDSSDTTTITRVLAENASETQALISGSASYDSSGNIYYIGRWFKNPDYGLAYRKWDRTTNTVSDAVVVDVSSVNLPYVSAKRGYSGNRIEFIYTDGTASPYEIKYNYVGGDPELYPAQITTSTASTATAYSNQRKIDRTSNGVLWTVQDKGAAILSYYYSVDDGKTWIFSENQDLFTLNHTPNASLFIDVDDYAHVVYKHANNGYIYYRRGTPNAGRTAWTWSAAQELSGSSNIYNFPDLVAHREGTGWVAHIVASFLNGSANKAAYAQVMITSDGTITKTLFSAAHISADYAAGTHTFPSIDFNHTGDGKTVASGTPHLYVAWSAGAAAAGKGIRFKKASYSGGTWTWGTEREIDSTRYVPNSWYWLNCLFDGTRVIIPGRLYSTTQDLVLYERDVADTATITRVLGAGIASSEVLDVGSATYDGSGNVYLFGRNSDEGSGNNDLVYRKWARIGSTLDAETVIDTGVGSDTYVSAKRGYSDNSIEFIYTDGTASPYSIKFGRLV